MRYGVTINSILSKINNSEWFSKNDLFVIVKYKDQCRRTSVIWNSNEPVWNEGFIFDDNDQQTVSFEIYDDNEWCNPELISRFELDPGGAHIRTITQNDLTIEIGDMFNERDVLLKSLKTSNNELINKNNLILEQNTLLKELGDQYKNQIIEIKQILCV